MRQSANIGIAVAILLVLSGEAIVQERPQITREALTAMFKAARTNPRTKWSIDGKCLWGYFFVDPDRQRLERAGQLLRTDGYHLVEVRGPSQMKVGLRFILHVEKAERHSVDTLLARNDRFYAFARKLGLESYDGMDVGPLPGGRCET
jgi:Regulator of ribonuclease activity B